MDHHRRVTQDWVSRSRTKAVELRVPLSKRWQLWFSTPGKSYLTLVGAPKYLRDVDWILDEFDSSFNELAAASLRYHLDYSVCDNEDRRTQYEDLIKRLTEPEPDTTDEESAAIATWHPLTQQDEKGRHTLTECPPAAAAAFDTWQSREEAWRARIDQARHDFVDIMRNLWS